MSQQQNLKDIIKKEYIKCALEPEYFMKKYCYIQVPNKGRQLFDLFQYQSNALKDFQEHRYNIVLKGRQIGISTLVAGYSLWRMLFKKDEQILVIAIKQEVAKNLVTKVKFMHELLPVWLRGNLIEDNKLAIRFANGSQMKATATRESAGRSEALSLLILDEAAFIENAEELWTAAQATLSTTGGSAILISTANGMGNFFHKTWADSETNVNDFNRIHLDWRVWPDRDEVWALEQRRQLGDLKFSQEHEASFIFSGNTVVAPEIIEFYKQTYVQEPLEKRGFDNNIWIWEPPNYAKMYIVAADVSRGDGADYSTFHVIDVEASTQVAEYKGKIPPKDFGNMLVAIATEYNDAIVIPDNSNIGWATIQQIIDRNYQNLFYMSKDLQYVDTLSQYNTKEQFYSKNMVPGFTISNRTRPLLIAKLESYMREQSITIRSARTMSELDTFIWKNGRPEAMDSYNDDLTMALSIGLWVRDTALRLKQEGVELNKNMLNNITSNKSPAIFTTKQANKEWEMEINGQTEDLRWLIG